ncbi:MAG: tetratricopeptide repeat protein [Cyanobacteria bacterium CRU_2_1]|nr:tetratricopeptide repeat protein [Cyanobacteria bacterium RU_5_0]NJR57873.1 tetratricopeptide repeat protein [Cyanobacteria bacterium CRU_2_1]
MKLYWLSATLILCLAIPVKAENLEHTQQLLSSQECAGCDLAGAGLVYANLPNANLSEADLSGANLSRANLRGANLNGANLAEAVLFNANLQGADLRGADLRGADLRGAVLSDAAIEGANFEGANLLGVVGLPEELATIETLYQLGLIEAERGNYRGAIINYNQVISQEPEIASVYLARGIARFRLGDQTGALEDARQAEELYLGQGNDRGQQAAVQFIAGIEAIQEAAQEQREEMQGGIGIGTNFLSFLGSLASLLLRFGL